MHLSYRRCVWCRCPSPLGPPSCGASIVLSGPTCAEVSWDSKWVHSEESSVMQSGGCWQPLEATSPTGTRTRFESRKMTVAFEETQMAEALHHSLSCSVVISQTHEICWHRRTGKDGVLSSSPSFQALLVYQEAKAWVLTECTQSGGKLRQLRWFCAAGAPGKLRETPRKKGFVF